MPTLPPPVYDGCELREHALASLPKVLSHASQNPPTLPGTAQQDAKIHPCETRAPRVLVDHVCTPRTAMLCYLNQGHLVKDDEGSVPLSVVVNEVFKATSVEVASSDIAFIGGKVDICNGPVEFAVGKGRSKRIVSPAVLGLSFADDAVLDGYPSVA